MGGFIAQTLALQHPNRVNKLILLSTDPGGSEADLASPAVWSQLVDTSGTPHDQAKRLLSLLLPDDVAESFYREFGDIVAAARGWHDSLTGGHAFMAQYPRQLADLINCFLAIDAAKL